MNWKHNLFLKTLGAITITLIIMEALFSVLLSMESWWDWLWLINFLNLPICLVYIFVAVLRAKTLDKVDRAFLLIEVLPLLYALIGFLFDFAPDVMM